MEAMRRALRERRTREVEVAEGLLVREMETRRPSHNPMGVERRERTTGKMVGGGGREEEMAQTRAGAGGPSNEPINASPSNKPINASPSNKPINASQSNEPVNADSSEEEDEEVSVDEEEAQVVLNEQEQDFFDQHNVHCQVCNQPGKVL